MLEKPTYQPRRDMLRSFQLQLKEICARPEVTRVCEFGGGANPHFSLDFIERNSLDYLVVDLSAAELDKAPAGYRMLEADVQAPDFSLDGSYDLVFSRWLLEHVKDPEALHRNVRRSLAPEGYALHLFPTLFALPFVVNRTLPDTLTSRVLPIVRSGRTQHGRHGKFPAFYRWCRGPSGRRIEAFNGLGYRVDRYVGSFGHKYYSRVPFIPDGDGPVADFLVRHPISWMTSFAYLNLRAGQVE
jgi:SAM-dependent methyltransferase